MASAGAHEAGRQIGGRDAVGSHSNGAAERERDGLDDGGGLKRSAAELDERNRGGEATEGCDADIAPLCRPAPAPMTMRLRVALLG
ncbi:hypothetical protein [Mycobacterium sp. ZZG]